ncbi:hypothetical protein RN51_03323 [Microbacterium oxydans]|uniref:Uncharacterized protein n=1 Tax=Microbacterium oxydans TaxID=82380 RepID=A0A0F0KDI7_9MICO|nr:hypothetical protein [Microbacterium oxydans]KJL18489.1 hypothetical protein RN51_03323 [Microbacterium oxydans]
MTDDEPQPIIREDLKTMTTDQIMTHYRAGDLDVLLGRKTAPTTQNTDNQE